MILANSSGVCNQPLPIYFVLLGVSLNVRYCDSAKPVVYSLLAVLCRQILTAVKCNPKIIITKSLKSTKTCALHDLENTVFAKLA